jgi:hypothetical protein
MEGQKRLLSYIICLMGLSAVTLENSVSWTPPQFG